MSVQTVNGLMSEYSLGITLPHEHIIMDFSCAWIQTEMGNECEINFSDKFDLEMAKQSKKHPQAIKANLIRLDELEAIEEIIYFLNTGGKTIVDPTSEGLKPNPIMLRDISKKTNVNIIAGCGFYCHFAQEKDILNLNSEQIENHILASFMNGIGKTDIKPGIIGEVGTSYPLTHFERESLVGSAKAQSQLNAALYIHPDIHKYSHIEILDVVEKAGANLSKIVICHVDQLLDEKWHKKIAERGVYLSFDTFSSEFEYYGVKEPRDAERIEYVLKLIESGYIDQILLSHDLCYKIQHHKYGGAGYEHIFTNILPSLRKAGVSEAELEIIMSKNPMRLLSLSECS